MLQCLPSPWKGGKPHHLMLDEHLRQRGPTQILLVYILAFSKKLFQEAPGWLSQLGT